MTIVPALIPAPSKPVLENITNQVASPVILGTPVHKPVPPNVQAPINTLVPVMIMSSAEVELTVMDCTKVVFAKMDTCGSNVWVKPTALNGTVAQHPDVSPSDTPKAASLSTDRFSLSGTILPQNRTGLFPDFHFNFFHQSFTNIRSFF